MYDLILKNGAVVLRENETTVIRPAHIAVTAGKIKKIYTKDQDTEAAKQTIDCTGLHILPGLIDSQVHFREPGHTYKEDLESGTRGAVAGGITAIFDMPNTKPSTDNLEAFNEKITIANKTAWCNFAFYAGATSKNIDALAELEQSPGCCGVKVFMGSSTGDLLVDQDNWIEDILNKTKRNIAFHCEDEERLKERKHIATQAAHPKAHPEWRDEMTAYLASERVINLCKKTGRKAHVLHVTTASEMEMLKKNKDHVTVEVTPQHLTLTSPDCYERSGTFAQMNPPIRAPHHRDGLWQGIENGTVDVIGSDHAPHSIEEKNKTYPNSPSGLTGVQTTVPLMLNHVNEGRLTLEKLTELLAYNPTQLFKIKNKGQIAPEFDADFTIVDMQAKKKITNEWIESKSQWTAFDEKEVQGWPVYTIIHGEVVMSKGQLIKPGQGQPIEFTDIEN